MLGEDAPFWDELGELLAAPEPPPAGATPAPPGAGVIEDRRGEGFAGVAGDLFSSGETVLVAVADVPRRRSGLEAVVAGLSAGPMAVTSWGALAAQPALAHGFDHLVALDPPPGGSADPRLRSVPRAHLAWGPAEAEFATTAWRAELDLRPQLTEVYRSLRELPPEALRARDRGGPARRRALSPQRARLRPPRARPDRAQPDRARRRRQDVPGPGRGSKRAGALTDLPGQLRGAGGDRARRPRLASGLAALGVDVEVVDEPGAETHRAHPELHRRVLARQQREQVGDHQ